MKKLLHTYIKNFQFFPKSAIYDDDARYRISEFNQHIATLYFIIKTKKVSFIPDTFHPGENYTFSGKLKIGEAHIDITFSTASMLYDFAPIKDNFKTIDAFTDYCMDQWQDPSRPYLSNSEKYAAKTTIDNSKSNENKLVINCMLQHAFTNGRMPEVTVNPYQLISMQDLKCLAPLEIIYIGKSNDDTWNRIYNHNKWGLIEEHRMITDELLIYFLEIDKSFIKIDDINDFKLIHRDESELSIEVATKATEAAFINYFIKHKKFNDHHVNVDITKNKTFSEDLKDAGYNELVAEVSLDSPFGVIGTTDSGYSDYHKTNYSF